MVKESGILIDPWQFYKWLFGWESKFGKFNHGSGKCILNADDTQWNLSIVLRRGHPQCLDDTNNEAPTVLFEYYAVFEYYTAEAGRLECTIVVLNVIIQENVRSLWNKNDVELN